jgi:hypothetical protein
MNVQGRVHILRVVAKGDGLEQGRRNWGGGQEGQLPLLPFARRGKGGRSAL